MAEKRPTIAPRSQLARGARKPAMNTPPIAGVWMKYANMNSEMSPPLVAMIATVLASVIARGTHSAWVWVAIQGSAARSARTLSGRMAARNAADEAHPLGGVAGAFALG